MRMDKLTYTFSEPLDANGEWQTDYGDAGEYTVTVTVSDGKSTVSEEILIVVEPKNREPVITGLQDITVKEGEVVYISPDVADYEDDPLEITISEPVGDDGVWETEYDDEGVYTVAVAVSDGINTVTKDVEVTVENFDREPVFDEVYPAADVNIKEGEEVLFSVWVNDPDEDILTYEWKLDGKNTGSTEKEYKYISGYNDAGEHTVEVIASDGEKSAIKSWKVSVGNVNRAPEIKKAPVDLSVKEGELVKIKFSAYDIDGDSLKYKVSEPIGNDMEWQTGYDDAGEYDIAVSVTDGDLEVSGNFKLTVEDVNRAPVFGEINNANVKEGEQIEFDVNAEDPDGKDVVITAENLPEGASFDGKRFTYTPPYYTVNHPQNLMQKILYGRKAKDMGIVFVASDGELSSKKKVRVNVEDVNLAPVLKPLNNIIANEGERAVLLPEATDPDGDEIKYTFAWPIGADGTWKTGYDDADVYTIAVTASDGYLEDSRNAVVTIQNVNRAPELNLINNIEVNEGEEAVIELSGSDADNDKLVFYAEHLPKGAVFKDGIFKWTPDYDSTKNKDEFVVDFSVSDGRLSDLQNATITVNDKNRAPVITGSSADIVKTKVGEAVVFDVKAEDADGDTLSYTWKFGLFDSTKGKAALKRTFSTAGKKIITVVVSDGKDSVAKKFGVLVYPKEVKKAEPAKTAQKQPVKKTTPAKTEPAKKTAVTIPASKPGVYVVEG